MHGADEFKGYDYAALKQIHQDLIRRRSKRGVKSIRNPRGYFLLATKFAQKEPLPVHLVTKQPNLGSNAIASNVAGYLDPNIQTYIRSTWWPLAHFNPITFKKNSSLDITKDDYIRFNCKVYRSLLPDIPFAEALRRIEKDWRDDTFMGTLNETTMDVSSSDKEFDDSVDDATPSSVASAERTMDLNLFSISVLDLATACTAGGMDALYLFLQSLRIRMKTVREFDELPKPKYSSDIMDTSGSSRITVFVECGKTYTEDMTETNCMAHTATLYQVGLFPTKLPLVTLFVSLDDTPMDMHVKAVDSSKDITESTPTWIVRNAVAGALVYKAAEIDITSIQFETLEYFVLPASAMPPSPTDPNKPKPSGRHPSYQMTCVLQEATAVEFESTFYGSVAAKRVRVFGLQHPSTTPLIVTLTTEPTKTATTAGRDSGRSGNATVSGAFYLVKQDVPSLASYKLQQYQVLSDSTTAAKTQIICEPASPGYYYAILFSIHEMQFAMEYNHTTLSDAVPSPCDPARENGVSAIDDVPTHPRNNLPCFFPGEKLAIQTPHSKASLRAKIYSHRMHTRMSQMQLLDETFRMKTAAQRQEIDARHKARRQQLQANIALDKAQQDAEAKRQKAIKHGGGATLQREVELLHEYFEHMAKTQPTFEGLRRLDEAYAIRFSEADQLTDSFDTVYDDDSEFKSSSAKARSAKFGVTDNRPSKDGVFAAEEYSYAATYLEKLAADLALQQHQHDNAPKEQAATDALEHNLYMALAESKPISQGKPLVFDLPPDHPPDDFQDDMLKLREILVESGGLAEYRRPGKREMSTVPVILPKKYVEAKLPWQAMWQAPPDPSVPDPLLPTSPKKHRNSSPPKVYPASKSHQHKEDEYLPPCSSGKVVAASKPSADISILTNILTRRPNNHVVSSSALDCDGSTNSLSVVSPRPSTAAPVLQSQPLPQSAVLELPITSKPSSVDVTAPQSQPTAVRPSTKQRITSSFRRRQHQPSKQLSLPWSRLQKGDAPRHDHTFLPVATAPSVQSDIVLIQQVPYNVIRHHNQIVALTDATAAHVSTLHPNRPGKTKRSRGTKQHRSDDAKQNLDKLELAKVLGNERMALMWSQVSDEFAWIDDSTSERT
ncbi:hypothetical protein H310_06710 [Aphanomyces invadans]|uniref:Uncharacterized protein n=1 Tax=Aphanomyces invadans TaxID=157072 RepID=A0A024U655_9STRA|nr:hypothetical protein H310_06710 [Aphanomyces invadans]ETW01093.1 hypothetical protein H310_06710 [Aphanomyces invadans]|eukprot:XP_008870091.1 hypothetical protein H310_06710 [Aphanomyces invadans]